MNISIKGYKSCRGNEGDAYSGTLVFDDTKVALFEYDGGGGEVMWHWLDQKARADWEAHVKALPADPGLGYSKPMAHNSDTALELEINKLHDRKRCRTKTLFRPTPESEDVFEVKAKFDPQVRAWVLTQHPQAVFLNEELAQEGA